MTPTPQNNYSVLSTCLGYIDEKVNEALNVKLKKRQKSAACLQSFSRSLPPSFRGCGHSYLPQCPWKKPHPDKNIPPYHCDACSFTFPLFLKSLVCPYRCFSASPPSSSLKRCSPPEALPLRSTVALNAPTPVILAPDSRSIVDKSARRSLAVRVLSV